jgi:hypothetical protein
VRWDKNKIMDDRMYVIKNNKTGKWIGIDKASGGYPYDTTIENAKIFHTKKAATDYRGVINEDWSLFRLEVRGVPECWANEA